MENEKTHSVDEKLVSTESRPQSLLKTTLFLSFATLISRVFGLVRDQLCAAFLGTEIYGDAFTIAFRIPNLLRDLFAEGALSAAFQPEFSKKLRKEGPQAAYQLANLVLSTLFVIIAVLVIVGIGLSSPIVAFWVPDFAKIPGKFELTVQLTQILMPFLMFASLAAVFMAILNTEERFTWPALASVFFNISSLFGGGILFFFNLRTSNTAALIWTLATLLGGFLQMAVQIPALRKTGYRFSFQLSVSDPSLQRIFRVMAPVALGLMAVQVNHYLNASLASREPGAVNWLTYSFRLMQLPVGLFGVAVGTVAMARYVKSSTQNVGQAVLEIRDTLKRSIRMVIFLTLPCLVGLFLLSQPLVSVLFQHGDFVKKDAQATAIALQLYSVGILAYAFIKVIAPVFYALSRNRIPVIGTLIAVIINAMISLTLYSHYGYKILAFSLSIATIANALFLLLCFQRFFGSLFSRDVLQSVSKMLISSILLGFCVKSMIWGFSWLISEQWLEQRFWWKLILLICATLGGASIYAISCYLLHVEEMKEVGNRLSRLIRKVASLLDRKKLK